jgi:3D (Asp-Asp-Asp) domain-containing protein
VQGKTVAADVALLPFGTCVEIEGVGRRVVQDTGSAIKGRAIDVYMADHADALEFGRREARVTRCE